MVAIVGSGRTHIEHLYLSLFYSAPKVGARPVVARAPSLNEVQSPATVGESRVHSRLSYRRPRGGADTRISGEARAPAHGRGRTR